MSKALLSVVLLPVALLLLLVSACGDDGETKEEYQAKVERQLENTDKRISELEARSGEATGEERSRLQQEAARLKDEREAVRGKLDELRSAGGDDWKKLKGEIDSGVSKMNESVDKALEELKN